MYFNKPDSLFAYKPSKLNQSLPQFEYIIILQSKKSFRSTWYQLQIFRLKCKTPPGLKT